MIWKTMAKDERLETVRKHVESGMTGEQIAAEFKDAPTRFAVLGFCHRNGLIMKSHNSEARRETFARRGSKPGPKPKPKAPRPSRVRLAPQPVARIEAPLDAAPMSWSQASDQDRCRWPLWDRFEGHETSLCCGAVRNGGGPYCDHHEQGSRSLGTESERRAPRDLKRHIMRERGIR